MSANFSANLSVKSAKLMEELWQIPALDQHAHNLLKPEAIARYPYSAYFSVSGQSDRFATQTLCYRRSIRDIAELLDCSPTEQAILERRENLGLESLSELCFSKANLEAIFLDDGFLINDILPVEWHQKFLPAYRVLRLEKLAETLIPQARSFDKFLEQFRSAIDPPPPGTIAFKSIAAYRSGLQIEPVPKQEAASSFYVIKKTLAEQPLYLSDKFLIDFLVLQGLEIAAKHKIPVQFHTGFGDPDLDLRLANPLHLRPMLEDSRYRQAPIVLLHGSYPFSREAGYLASVYERVYLDFGLALPFLSVSGMRSTLAMLLEVAPIAKIMYSSDAHLIPELYYLAAKWGRSVLAGVLEQAVCDGDLTAREVESVAIALLRDNARSLYSLAFEF